MLRKELKFLPSDTVRLIGSSQVITSVYSVVKELTENSFDAECTSLEVKLENYGLDKIEVRDNGFGIRQEGIPAVAKRHHTSKISSFSDLESLETYGFRGEALGSLCAVSTLSVTSKTCDEDVSHTVTFDTHGNVVSQIPSHLGQGTTVSAVNIFKNMPVRRQFYNTAKKKKEELKKVEDLLMVYGAIRPDVRIVLRNNKDVVWQKSVQKETKTVLIGIFGRNAVAQMEHRLAQCSDSQVSLEAFVPRSNSEVSTTSRSTNDRCFLAVNRRPVQLKEFEKVVKQHYCQRMGCDGRYPMFYISLIVPPREIDVNVDPNKTKVMLHQQVAAMNLLISVLEDIYGPLQKVKEPEIQKLTESLNDSCVSNLSLDSSFDSPVLGREDFSVRKGLKEKNYNTQGDKLVNEGRLCSLKSSEVSKEQTFAIDRNNENSNKANSLLKGTNDQLKVIEHNCKKADNVVGLGNKLIVTHSEISEVANVDLQFNEGSKKSFVNEDTPIIQESNEIAAVNVYLGDVQTQVDKCNFDILGEDLEKLLQTQDKVTATVDALNETDNILAGIDIPLVDALNETDNVLAGMNTPLVEDYRELAENINSFVEDTNGDKESVNTNKESEHRKINVLDWSKGVVAKESDSMVIQPVQVLATGGHVTRKRPASPNQDLDFSAIGQLAKRKSAESSLDQPTLYDMVSKSPAERYPLGFLSFSKEERPKVLEDNPDLDYDEITAKVRQRWQELPDLDKKEFEESGKIQVKDLKKKVSERKRLSQKLDRRLKVNGTPSIKDQLLASSKKPGQGQNITIKSVKISFSLGTLQQRYNSGFRQTQTQIDKSLQLIGPLKFFNGWICHHDDHLQIINPHRIEETLLYRELMENHIIPATKLDNSVGINESSLGSQDLYKKLLELVPSSKTHTYIYLEDKRLKYNGIEIRCHMDQESQPVLEIVGLASCMPMYGMKDLQEVMDLIVNSGASNVYQARPLKVSFYLQGEAVRMVRQRPVHRSREDVLELLEQMEDNLPAECDTCLHNKVFIQNVFNMNDIPFSQTLK